MARQLKTSYPLPSSPFRPPVFNMKFEGPGKFSLHGFCEIYAGRAFLDAVLGDDDYTWIDEETILVTSTELRIHSSHLEQIIESSPTDYQLPIPYSGYAAALSSRIKLTPASTPRPSTSSHTPTDGLSIQDLADELGLEPRKVRSVLRRRMNKSAPWTFTDEEAATARSILARDC